MFWCWSLQIAIYRDFKFSRLVLNLFHLRLHSLSRLQSVSLEALFTWLSHIDTFCLHFATLSILIDTSSFTHFDPRPQLSSLQIFSFFIAPSCAIPIVHRLVHIVSSVFLYRVQKRVCLQLRPSWRLSVASVLTSSRCVRLDVFPLASFTSHVLVFRSRPKPPLPSWTT